MPEHSANNWRLTAASWCTSLQNSSVSAEKRASGPSLGANKVSKSLEAAPTLRSKFSGVLVAGGWLIVAVSASDINGLPRKENSLGCCSRLTAASRFKFRSTSRSILYGEHLFRHDLYMR